ncbi:MAG: hypothetical protein QM769_04995 [Pseudoxanthomonas sp.]
MLKNSLTLLSPVNYLRISQKHKRAFDWGIPLAISGLLFGAAWFLPHTVVFLGEKGLISKIAELLQVLVGFYIAGLAAVSTYKHPALDQPVAGAAATLVRSKGATASILNRRQLISFLFSYLAFLSLSLYFTGLIAEVFSPLVGQIGRYEIRYLLANVLRFAYVFGCAQMIIVTLLGMFYLGDRIHRADPVLVPRVRQKPEDDGGTG